MHQRQPLSTLLLQDAPYRTNIRHLAAACCRVFEDPLYSENRLAGSIDPIGQPRDTKRSVGTGQKTVRNFPKSHSLFRHLDIGKKIPGYAATRVSPKGSVPVHTPPFGQALLHQGGQIGLGRVIPRRGHLHYWQLVSPLTASLVTVSVMMVTWWRCYQRTKYMWYTI